MKTKTRLTITLSQDLLSKVDLLIDTHTIRNRSQAIESLVRQGLKADLKLAVVLAGGDRKNNDILESTEKRWNDISVQA